MVRQRVVLGSIGDGEHARRAAKRSARLCDEANARERTVKG